MTEDELNAYREHKRSTFMDPEAYDGNASVQNGRKSILTQAFPKIIDSVGKHIQPRARQALSDVVKGTWHKLREVPARSYTQMGASSPDGSMDWYSTPSYDYYISGQNLGRGAQQALYSQIPSDKNILDRVEDMVSGKEQGIGIEQALNKQQELAGLTRDYAFRNSGTYTGDDFSAFTTLPAEKALSPEDIQRRQSLVDHIRNQDVTVNDNGNSATEQVGSHATSGPKLVPLDHDIKADPPPYQGEINLRPAASPGELAHEWGHILDMRRNGLIGKIDPQQYQENSTKYDIDRSLQNVDSQIPLQASSKNIANAHLYRNMLPSSQEQEEQWAENPNSRAMSMGALDTYNKGRRRASQMLLNSPTVQQEINASREGLRYFDEKMPGSITPADRRAAFLGIPSYQTVMGRYFTDEDMNEVKNRLQNESGIEDITPSSFYHIHEPAWLTRPQHFDPRRAKWNPGRSVNV